MRGWGGGWVGDRLESPVETHSMFVVFFFLLHVLLLFFYVFFFFFLGGGGLIVDIVCFIE